MASASEIEPQPGGTFWMLNLEEPVPDRVEPRLAARFGRLDAEAALVLAQAMELAGPALVLERFAAGKRCYGAWVAGTLAAYGWVTFDEEEIGELGMRVRLTPGEAYIWNCATLPPYRGQRLYPALLLHISRELRAEGFRQILIGADSDNLASQKGFLLASFQPIADMRMIPAQPHNRLWLLARPDAPEHLVQHVRQALYNTEGEKLWTT